MFATELKYEGGLQTASGLDNFINVGYHALQAWMHLLIKIGRQGVNEENTWNEDLSY